MLNGQSIQPDGMIKITLMLTDEQAEYADLQIVYIAEDGTVTIIPSTVSGKTISFIIDHLSYYGIIGTAVEATDQDGDDSAESPRTGDDSVGGFIFLAILSLGIGGVALKRKPAKDRRDM